MRGECDSVDYRVIVIQESKKFNALPWEFEKECTQEWWERILEYPRYSSQKRGIIPEWAFILQECYQYKILPWRFEAGCSQEWWEELVIYNNALNEHHKFLADRQRSLRKMREALRKR